MEDKFYDEREALDFAREASLERLNIYFYVVKRLDNSYGVITLKDT